MNASIVLDQPANVSFTNLDQISGRVVVRCGKSADVSSIIVKLEGESRTRLLSPGRNGDKPRAQVEYHKLLYKTQTVFPSADVLDTVVGGKSGYTLPPGQHEYAFSFKIPFNNTCNKDTPQVPIFLSLEGARPAAKHVKKTLPPTMGGFPGEAEIRYFVKVTVNRPSIFKENPRAMLLFNFFPIEPPRPPVSGSEIYARQKHDFAALPDSDGAKAKMKGLFKRNSISAAPTSPLEGLSVSIDARLPEPTILTCNSDVPLRIIVKRLNQHKDMIHLHSLQIALIGSTKIRAHDVFRTETTSWIIMSKANLGIPVGALSDPVGTESVLDDAPWRGQTIPNTVAPSFETCNVERSYQLDVRVGLNCHGQHIVLPLRLNTLVYSGIAPPQEVLDRMAQTKPSITRPAAVAKHQSVQVPGRRTSELGANQVPPTPIEESGSLAAALPSQSVPTSTLNESEYADAPPSYEDAIASDLPPVSVDVRPSYAPPPSGEDELLGRDEKRGWVD